MAKIDLVKKDKFLKLTAVLCAIAALVLGTLRVILWIMHCFPQGQFGSGNTVIIGGADGPTVIYTASSGFPLSPGWIGVILAAVALAITLYLTGTGNNQE